MNNDEEESKEVID